MSYNTKNFIIHLKYPLDLPPLPKNTRQSLAANWVEALANLNNQLRLYNAKKCEITIDYHTDGNYRLLSKRYIDDVLLSYYKDGSHWELLSRNYKTIAANTQALALYIEHLRKAERHKIHCRNVNSSEPVAWAEDIDPVIELEPEPEQDYYENDIFKRIKQTTWI